MVIAFLFSFQMMSVAQVASVVDSQTQEDSFLQVMQPEISAEWENQLSDQLKDSRARLANQVILSILEQDFLEKHLKPDEVVGSREQAREVFRSFLNSPEGELFFQNDEAMQFHRERFFSELKKHSVRVLDAQTQLQWRQHYADLLADFITTPKPVFEVLVGLSEDRKSLIQGVGLFPVDEMDYRIELFNSWYPKLPRTASSIATPESPRQQTVEESGASQSDVKKTLARIREFEKVVYRVQRETGHATLELLIPQLPSTDQWHEPNLELLKLIRSNEDEDFKQRVLRWMFSGAYYDNSGKLHLDTRQLWTSDDVMTALYDALEPTVSAHRKLNEGDQLRAPNELLSLYFLDMTNQALNQSTFQLPIVQASENAQFAAQVFWRSYHEMMNAPPEGAQPSRLRGHLGYWLALALTKHQESNGATAELSEEFVEKLKKLHATAMINLAAGQAKRPFRSLSPVKEMSAEEKDLLKKMGFDFNKPVQSQRLLRKWYAFFDPNPSQAIHDPKFGQAKSLEDYLNEAIQFSAAKNPQYAFHAQDAVKYSHLPKHLKSRLYKEVKSDSRHQQWRPDRISYLSQLGHSADDIDRLQYQLERVHLRAYQKSVSCTDILGELNQPVAAADE